MDGERDREKAHVPSADEIGGAALEGNVVVEPTGAHTAEAAGTAVVVADEVVEGVPVAELPIEPGYEGISSMGFE